MEDIRQYMISVIAISILCGIVVLFFRETSYKGVVKVITGLIVTVTVLKPALKGEEIRFDQFWDKISINSRFAVQQGQEAAELANAAYIKETLESYISSKANEMGVDITADVDLQEDALQQPKEVVITGSVSPYVKRRLTDMIVNDLGITEDKQIWIS